MNLIAKVFIAFFILLAGTALLMLATDGTSAATITVKRSDGGDYTTIQEAIDNAETNDTSGVWEGRDGFESAFAILG